jgi:hypothetical protein
MWVIYGRFKKIILQSPWGVLISLDLFFYQKRKPALERLYPFEAALEDFSTLQKGIKLYPAKYEPKNTSGCSATQEVPSVRDKY